MKTFTCSICGKVITNEYGNNAYPINSGICCDKCNDKVIVARIAQISAYGVFGIKKGDDDK